MSIPQVLSLRREGGYRPLAWMALIILFFLLSGVELQCIGYFPILFELLSVRWPAVALAALQVVGATTKSHECLADIAAADQLGRLLPLLRILPDGRLLTLDTVYTLLTSPKLVKEAVQKGELWA